MQKGDFNDAELKGVADEIKRAGKLKELADELEMNHQLQSLENAPFTLLQRWCSGIESGIEAHTLLVHHLKCIGMPETSHRYPYTTYYPTLKKVARMLKYVNFASWHIGFIIGSSLHFMTPQPEQVLAQ